MKHLPDICAMLFWWLIIVVLGYAFNLSFHPGLGLGLMVMAGILVTLFYINEIANSK